MRRKTPKDYHDFAQSRRSLKWLGPKVPNVNTKTWWECDRGHQWETCLHSLQNGAGCPICAGTIPKTADDYYALAEQRGFIWCGPEVSNVSTKTWWSCNYGHKWSAHYSNIRNGTGCPFCARGIKSAADFHILAKKNGFEWLGQELPPNTQSKTPWKCSERHIWESTYNIIQSGKGCPFCGGKAPKTIEDYHALAQERNFSWLGNALPETTFIKAKWKCPEGHTWSTTYASIRNGKGCPKCDHRINGAKTSRLQRRLCKMLGGELNYPCDSYRIDVALPDKMIAIEYDCWFWHGHKQNYDAQRDADLIAARWKVLHIKSNNQLPSKREIEKGIAQLIGGEEIIEIILDDWEQGPTRGDISN